MNTLSTSKGVFTISKPTLEDGFTVAEEMRALAKKKVMNPVQFVYQTCQNFPPVWAEAALKLAIALGASGGAAPSPELEEEQYTTEEGLTFRLWYYVNKNHKDFTMAAAKEIVAADHRYVIARALNDALTFPEDAKKNETETGTTL